MQIDPSPDPDADIEPNRRVMSRPLRLALPKGRMQHGVLTLLAEAGIEVAPTSRSYRPRVSLEHVEAKMLKPQNIVEMLALGSRDVGFAGADWVEELKLDVVELLDTGLDPVRVVAAAPTSFDMAEGRPLNGGRHRVIVASEYERLSTTWITARGLDAEFVRSFGATEVFPPEDADIIIDNTATGATLRANDLQILETIMTSSTRLYASPRALEVAELRDRIQTVVLLTESVLEARRRVMVEVNAPPDCLEAVVAAIPAMKHPTVSPLSGDSGFAVKAAVPRDQLPTLIPRLKSVGGSDVVVSPLTQIVP